MKTVWVSRDFGVPADQLFAHVVSYDAFQEVEPSGLDLSAFKGRVMRPGDHLDAPFPPLPFLRWSVDIVRVDAEQRLIKSEEQGGFIQRWAHTMTVTPLDAQNCRYVDHVVIEAGALSGFVARNARKMYERRQEARAKILEKE